MRLIKILSLNCFFSFFYSLKLLNKEILLWTFNFSFSDLFYGVSFKLDFFTYKLIWKLVRKLHPRRPNTWIYNKYWKFYNNTIKFVLYDFSSSQLLFLITHSVIFFPYRNFPNFLNNYDYSNIKRVNFLSYNSFFGYLYNVYYYLWKRQFGLCVMCFRVFDVYILFFVGYKMDRYLVPVDVRHHAAEEERQRAAAARPGPSSMFVFAKEGPVPN